MPLLDDVVVREFRMSDKQLVTDFFDQMGGESRSFINRGDSSRILAMKFFDGITEDRVMFLAEYEGRMVGFIFLFGIVFYLSAYIKEFTDGHKLVDSERSSGNRPSKLRPYILNASQRQTAFFKSHIHGLRRLLLLP